MIAHFLSRGHTLEEMTGLSPMELRFYRIAWELEAEYMAKLLRGE